MPELPEVETIARGLRGGLLGATVESLRCPYPPIVLGGPRALARRVVGRRFEEVLRHGKYLFLAIGEPRESTGARPAGLTGNQPAGLIAVHLRMTGQLYLADPAAALDAHVHLELTLGGRAGKLVYRDVRKFGRLQWVPGRDPRAFIRRKGLGEDALRLPLGELEKLCRGTGRALKALLLDQSRIAGVGNIYADEILFRCRLSARRSARGLSPEELRALHRAIGEVLNESIERQGTTISDFVGARGEPGGFQSALRVYGREGEACPDCGSLICRSKVAGRSTFQCPRCQPVVGGGRPA